MLSNVQAAEAQFRFDTASRYRDHAILVAISERRLALSGVETMGRSLTSTAWPRPIHARPIVRPVFAAA